jgi:hypothetical protein
VTSRKLEIPHDDNRTSQDLTLTVTSEWATNRELSVTSTIMLSS